jgi:hypothetical protein
LLDRINESYAREPVEADDIFLFPGVLSTQGIDSYGTRMAPSSMKAYRQTIESEGVPLMNSHRTGGFLQSSELPVGRVIEGRLSGDALKVGEVEFDEQRGLELEIASYMLRGVEISDVSNDDLIASIDGGTSRGLSIGAMVNIDSLVTCSVCGEAYLPTPARRGMCEHLAFVDYDGQRCFAWLESMDVVEGSLVWAGATPGAMVQKARAMAPDLDRGTVELLEDVYSCRLRDVHARSVKNMPAPVDAGQAGETLINEEVVSMDRDALLVLVAEFIELEELEANYELGETDQEFVEGVFGAMTDQLNLARGMQADSASMAVIGRQVFDGLVADAVAARVRAEGDAFDADRYQLHLERSDDLEFIRAELDTWTARAAEVLQAGPGQTRETEQSPNVSVPASAYR